MKTPEELAEEYCSKIADTHSVKTACEKAFLAGYKTGREMSEKEIFDHYIELRKKNGDKEPVTYYERIKITLKGIF
jgi:hypothetical protein